MKAYARLIRNVPDFPKPGIQFKDITPLVGNAEALREVTEDFYHLFRNERVTHVIGIESRGFIFGALLAYRLGVGFVPVRKPGKLPAETISAPYSLEYGENVLHMHKDALPSGSSVVILDDLLATGGTLKAAADLATQLGASIAGIGVVIELAFLKGRDRLNNFPLHTLIRYEGE